MKNKIKTTSFWIGLCGSILVIFDSLSGVLGIADYSDELKNILFSICTILVLCGVINKKEENGNTEENHKDLIHEIKDELNKEDE